MLKSKPTIGLALSGSGNRTTFYIGFLEVLGENNISVDYIAACSGGSVVAAAYACGTMEVLKNFVLNSGSDEVRRLIKSSKNGGGIYSLELLEDEMRTIITKGSTFEQVSPKLAFVAVDIDSGKKVTLCMGDIAKAACISSTVPGLIEPYSWGSHTLVDGGILTIVPLDALKDWGPDITIGINLRATKHIFSQRQITLKKAYNFLKKLLFVDEIESIFSHVLPEDSNEPKHSGIFSVWGRSLDLVIKTAKKEPETQKADLLLVPDFPRLKRSDVSKYAMAYHYDLGRKFAEKNLPQIQKVIAEKS